MLAAVLPARAGEPDDHAQAAAALADVRAAIAEIVSADASFSTDRARYHASAQTVIDTLVGDQDKAFAGHPAQGADRGGALGHIDHLLDRKETAPWADLLRAADVNLRSAIAKLRRAEHARELMDYQIAVSQALANLEVARGRATEGGVLGGLEGALATTALGIPEGSAVVDGCAAPPGAPAYGVHDGLLAYVAVPANQGVHALQHDYGTVDVTVQGSVLLLHTSVAARVAAACDAMKHAEAAPADLPKLYTHAQAVAGEGLFLNKCAGCHGTNLRGLAAPGVAGTDFLRTARQNSWTLKIVRYLVFNMMPLNAAGSLTKEQYASVMAFLLASNCYPAGDTPFPTADQPAFASIQLAPVSAGEERPDGVCPL